VTVKLYAVVTILASWSTRRSLAASIEKMNMVIDKAIFAFQSKWGVSPREVVSLVRGKASAASWTWPAVPVGPVSNPILPDIHCLSLVLRAMEGDFWIEGNLRFQGKIEAPSTVINAADCGSGWSSASPVSFFHVYLSDPYLRSFVTNVPHQIAAESPRLRFQNGGFLHDGLVRELLLTLSRSGLTSNVGDRSYRAALTDSLARHIVRCHALHLASVSGHGFATHDPFEHLVEAIKTDPGQPYTVEKFRQMTGMSGAQLTAQFKLRTGNTPYKYLLSQRLELAKRELETSHVCLSDLAIRLGFVDQAHFSHAFRRYTGTTPGRARTPNTE
jgi:AraC family transcriptional regulator